MAKRNQPIGIFDSGIGGLTVVKEVIKQLPKEDIIYFGDTARVPYGNKSAQTVIKFSIENVRFLLKFGVKLVIVACNTSSSLALPTLRRRFRVPILGVIRPAVKKAAQIAPRDKIGIIGTRATVASNCYQREIKRISPASKALTQACPLFVPLAEEGWLDNQITLQVVQRYLTPLAKKKIKALILGCTHYPLLKKIISKVLGNKVELIDSAKETARVASKILKQKGLCATHRSRLGKCSFYVTDEPAWFRKVGRRFLGKTVRSVQKT